MFPNFIITFRETLEATLIIGIVLSFLANTKQTAYNNSVFLGSIFGVIASLIGAIIFSTLANGFSGETEQIFEGITMIFSSTLIATMIIWMQHQNDIAKNLTKKIAQKIELAKTVGIPIKIYFGCTIGIFKKISSAKSIEFTKKIEIFFLIFFAILREGIEIVLFLSTINLTSRTSHFWASLSGILIAIIIGYAVFASSTKINVKLFFRLSTVILILFGAGLFAHGIHELQDARLIPTIIKETWDINPKVTTSESYPILHEKGFVGNFLKELFGYNANPSLLESLGYITYLTAFWLILKNQNKKIIK
ncbi:MAG: FTR1 family protein [Pseudomonadales bacterium]|nr:FTR1 family protein [Pseudomonadales bacterium]